MPLKQNAALRSGLIGAVRLLSIYYSGTPERWLHWIASWGHEEGRTPHQAVDDAIEAVGYNLKAEVHNRRKGDTQ